MPSVDQRPLKFIIVGAGIAGLAAARALREHEVLILEQSSLKRELGAAIHLGPNASKIALAWGMDLERTKSPECIGYHQMAGETGEVQIKADMNPRAWFGAPWLFNHRVDLHNELRRLATSEEPDLPGKPATIRSGAKVVAADCMKGTVTLDSGEVLSADVIVGADGIHSLLRAEVLGDVSIASPSGHSAYRCLIPADVLLKDPELSYLVTPLNVKETVLTTWMARDRRVVVYPCRNFEYLNVVAIIPDASLHEESVESWSAEGSVDELVKAFGTFVPLVQKLLSLAPACALWQLRDQDPLPTWVKGNAILCGDSSHAMLPHQGQGGGQAIEDAEALGAVFSGVSHHAELSPSINERLLVVEKLRKERAGKIQGYSRAKANCAKVGTSWSVDPTEFAKYNSAYNGAVDWGMKHGIEIPK